MIKQNLLNFTALFAILVMTGSASIADAPKDTAIEPVTIVMFAEPTSPEKGLGLTELDKIALHYEKQIEVEETKQATLRSEQEKIILDEWAEQDLFIKKQERIDTLLDLLMKQVGVTPYGFGDTPETWDCSGLTKWYLGWLDVDVEHSATSQAYGGSMVTRPIAGDLVAFQKYGSSDYFHIGVYVGGGLMVHASNPDKGTNVQSIYDFATYENSKIVFVRY